MKKVICVVGPTGVGKTAMSIALAKALNTEIISGDSIQVYRDLDIGSAKVREDEMDGIVHHLIDILDAKEGYSVKEFQDMARHIAHDLHQRGKIPIIAGGTGLYVKSFLYDYHFDASSDRSEVDLSMYEDKSTDELYARLQVLDRDATMTIHPNNRKRIIRALSIFDASGKTKSDWIAQQSHQPLYDAFMVGLTCDRQLLHERINQRVELMFEAGLLEEIKGLVGRGVSFDDQCMQGIGYQEFRGYFADEKSISDVLRDIKTHTRQFAKRQYTWFRNQMNVTWYDIMKEDVQANILRDCMQWLGQEEELWEMKEK